MNTKFRGRCRLVILTILLFTLLGSSVSVVQSDAPFRVYLPVIFSPRIPLPDSSFESETATWILFPSTEQLIYSQPDFPTGIVPRTGSHAAWLGYHSDSDPTLQNSISQQIVIPSIVPHLSFWTQIQSKKICGSTQSRLSVYVNGQLQWLKEPCKSVSIFDWSRQIVDLTQFANQEVTLTIRVTLEAGDTAQIFLDDFEFSSN